MLDLHTAAREIHAGRRGPNVGFEGVTTDSRHIAHRDLFVALKGDRFDGHAFVDDALEAGAAGAMVEETDRVKTRNASLLLVNDTRAGLGQLAAHWRRRFALPLVAVTGSNGKTTAKEMIAACLRAAAGERAVLATTGNLNNDIGVPLMLLRLRSHHRCAVIEMGMNHTGEIRYLTGLAAPTVALITNAGTAHIGEVGSRDAIARAKGEIYEGLAAEGCAVINADDAFADYWRGLNRGRRVIDFGLDQPATVRATYRLSAHDAAMHMSTPKGEFGVSLRVPGLHNVRNALAACAAAYALDIPPGSIARGLNTFEGAKGRLEDKPCRGGGVIIDDTYNANPDSVQAAIAVLAAVRGKRVLVLGDMGELGTDERALHAEVGAAAKQAGVHFLLTLGERSEAAADAFGTGAQHFRDLDALCGAVAAMLGKDTTILVKGSRFMQMERVVQRFADPAPLRAGGDGS